MRTALKLYDIYGIFTFLYSLAERFFTDTRKDAYSTETIRHIRHLYVSLQLSKNDSLQITRKDAYSTEILRHTPHLYVSLQLSKTILYRQT